MSIDFSALHYKFIKKPLIVGGMAMQFYGLRKSGNDIDLIVCKEDIINLVNLYPHNLKDLYGDLGIAIHDYEIWKTICYFDYNDLKNDAIDLPNYKIISLEKLLFLKALAMKIPKYQIDLLMVVDKIITTKKEEYGNIILENKKIINALPEKSYIEKTGPDY